MGAYANPGIMPEKTISRGMPGQNQHGLPGPTPVLPGNTPMPGGSGRSGGSQPYPNPIFGGNPYMAPNPFQVPGNTTPMNYPWGSLDPTGAGGSGTPGHSTNLGHGLIATGLQYPGLSQDFVNYLMGQVGAGVQPFNLSTPLPGGGMTQPGQLTAPLNSLLSSMQNWFQGGTSNIPGLSTLSQIANKGVDATPEWKAMVNAQQQNIQQNEANLREQFASMGDLAGSPFGTAMSNYASQTTADQNSLLGQLQMQGLLQGQLPTAESLFQGAQQFGTGLQNLSQEAIQNQLQEFIRTQPQNNPILQYLGAFSSLYPPTNKTATGFEQFTGLLSALQGSGFTSSGGTSIGF